MSTRVAVAEGKNWVRFGPFKPRDPERLKLSREAKMTALAGMALLITKQVGVVLYTGGKTAGREYPSESSEMRKFAAAEFGIKLPSDDPTLGGKLLVDEVSWDTASGLREADKLRQALGDAVLLLVTVGLHMERTEYLANSLEIPYEAAFVSEGVLDVYGIERPPFRAGDLLSTTRQHALETPALLAAHISPEGGIGGLVTRLTRHQTGTPVNDHVMVSNRELGSSIGGANP